MFSWVKHTFLFSLHLHKKWFTTLVLPLIPVHAFLAFFFTLTSFFVYKLKMFMNKALANCSFTA